MHSPHPNGDADSPEDAEVLAAALRKVVNREPLTKAERRALKRHEKQKEERLRWKFYRSIPQKHWRKMSGRQAKVINEQAIRHGIPFGGETIDLTAVVRAFHDFLAANAIKLSRDEELMMQGPASPALEAYRDERAKIAKIQREQLERQRVPRDEVRQSLGRIATIIRGVGDSLQRSFGPEAAEILHEALEDAEREIELAFGSDEEGISIDQPERADPEVEPDGAD